jgi:hypothetical protein
MDHELYVASNPNDVNFDNRTPFSSLIASHKPEKLIGNGKVNGGTTMAQRWQVESNLYVDTARLLISLLHAWNIDDSLDGVCLNKLKFNKPSVPLCFGSISRRGESSSRKFKLKEFQASFPFTCHSVQDDSLLLTI